MGESKITITIYDNNDIMNRYVVYGVRVTNSEQLLMISLVAII